MFVFITQAVSEFAKEWRRQAAIRELDKLNDHLLADIGLRREQLPTFMMEETSRDEREPYRGFAVRPEPIGCG